MNDRDIEDTRQPKKEPRMYECDGCGGEFAADELVRGYLDEWLCPDCWDETTVEEAGHD